MPCPYFYPLARFEYHDWPSPSWLPLGDPYRGECRACPERIAIPDEQAIKQLCNFGYAAGRCPSFPAGPGPDAVRFAVAAHGSGRVSIVYAIEKSHLPFENGRLEYLINSGSFRPEHPDERIQRQAAAYLESYLRRARAI